MTNPHGSWIWYELMTSDAAASKAFYEAVVGWTIQAESTAPGNVDYRMIDADDGQIGGMLTLDSGMLAGGASPCWLGYLGVEDVDATVERIGASGGSVHLPPRDIPGVGRLAMVADPQGAPFYVMRGAIDKTSTAYGRRAMGHVSWNELQTSDDHAGFDFYSSIFGWEEAGGMPMPWGEYRFLRGKDSGDSMEVVWGAMMPREKADHPIGWTFYFRVPDIERAFAKVKELGGVPKHDPMEVPGGERVFVATDPLGVTFGLVAPG